MVLSTATHSVCVGSVSILVEHLTGESQHLPLCGQVENTYSEALLYIDDMLVSLVQRNSFRTHRSYYCVAELIQFDQ